MIQVLICDDEAAFAESLRLKIRAVFRQLQIPSSIFCYQDPDVIPPQVIRTADLILLDIDFSNKDSNGLDLARKLRETSRNSLLIFVTNYVEYAPEGYEVQAFRYLLKSELDEKLGDYLQQALKKLEQIREKITVTVNGEPCSILRKDILYLQSEGHTVHIVTQDRTVRVYGTMSQWEEKLSAGGFLRTQKSYLVNMQQIRTYQCDGLTLKNGITLPVSEKFYGEQKKQYLLWKGMQ